MRFQTLNCPTCGEQARGTVERMAGAALLTHQPDGSSEYEGTTDIWWDEQRTQIDAEGRWELICIEGHQWASKEIE